MNIQIINFIHKSKNDHSKFTNSITDKVTLIESDFKEEDKNIQENINEIQQSKILRII